MTILLSTSVSMRFSGMIGLLQLCEVLFAMADRLALRQVIVVFSDGGRVILRDEGERP